MEFTRVDYAVISIAVISALLSLVHAVVPWFNTLILSMAV